MASSTDVLRVAALALLVSGCVSGHLLDHARRREQLRTVHEAAVAGDELLVRYTAVDVDDAGEVVGTTTRWAAIPLADVTDGARPVDTLSVTWLGDAEARRRGGRPLAVTAVAAGAPSLAVVRDDRRDTAIVLRQDGRPEAPPLDTRAFTRVHVRPWVWPLLPFTLAVDAVGTPTLLVFAPIVIGLGD